MQTKNGVPPDRHFFVVILSLLYTEIALAGQKICREFPDGM